MRVSLGRNIDLTDQRDVNELLNNIELAFGKILDLRSIAAGDADDILTNQGADQLPAWDTPAFDGAYASLTGLPTLGTAAALTGSAGVYSPTAVNVANLDATPSLSECQYMRLGATVTVSGIATVNPTAGATLTQLGIPLPIASNIGAVEDCAGVAFASGIAGQGAAIVGDVANDRAEMRWISGDVTNQPMYFSFTYQVI